MLNSLYQLNNLNQLVCEQQSIDTIQLIQQAKHEYNPQGYNNEREGVQVRFLKLTI
jgi:hypothetical protein